MLISNSWLSNKLLAKCYTRPNVQNFDVELKLCNKNQKLYSSNQYLISQSEDILCTQRKRKTKRKCTA